MLDPLFATYYAIPIFAFYPLFIVMFGLGDGPQVADRLHAGRGRRHRHHAERPRPGAARAEEDRAHQPADAVADRAAGHPAVRAPYLLTAAKLALAYAFIGVIGSEFIMARSGMGYEIGFAYTNFDNATMYPLILLILLLSIIDQRRAVALGEGAAGPAGQQ